MSELYAERPKEPEYTPANTVEPEKTVQRPPLSEIINQKPFDQKSITTENGKVALAQALDSCRNKKASEETVTSEPKELSDIVTDHAYTVLGELGAGGQGKVFKIEYGDGRVVTRKYVDKSQTVDRELLAKTINHPNVVKVLGVGEDENGQYVEREYFDAKNLRDMLNEHKTGLSPKEVLKYGKQLVEAFIEIHKNELVHGDVTPENILIDKNGVLKVTDFGIARPATKDKDELKRSLTTIIERAGKLEYMAPETLRYGEITEKSDAYGLAKVLVEMATGIAPPFADQVFPSKIPEVYEFAKSVAAQCLIENPIRRTNVTYVSRCLSELENTIINAVAENELEKSLPSLTKKLSVSPYFIFPFKQLWTALKYKSFGCGYFGTIGDFLTYLVVPSCYVSGSLSGLGQGFEIFGLTGLLAMGLISKIGGELIFKAEIEKQDALKEAKQLVGVDITLHLKNVDIAPAQSETNLPVKEGGGLYSRLKESVKKVIQYAGNVVGELTDRTHGSSRRRTLIKRRTHKKTKNSTVQDKITDAMNLVDTAPNVITTPVKKKDELNELIDEIDEYAKLYGKSFKDIEQGGQ
ncbi:MAG: serine/threonine protein kinase [Candidatus Aenigmarchaeota archaeon]|nr:serine/threonine protein kinase [Candidatus Aenigmarchaeota archaeon]